MCVCMYTLSYLVTWYRSDITVGENTISKNTIYQLSINSYD